MGTKGTKFERSARLVIFANEIRKRSLFKKPSKNVFNSPEFNDKGKEILKPITKAIGISNSYSKQTFIELNLLREFENGDVEWIGDSNINEITKLLAEWLREYGKKPSKKELAAIALAQSNAVTTQSDVAVFAETELENGKTEFVESIIEQEAIETISEIQSVNETGSEQPKKDEYEVLTLDQLIQAVEDNGNAIYLAYASLRIQNGILIEAVEANKLNREILAELKTLNLSKSKKKV